MSGTVITSPPHTRKDPGAIADLQNLLRHAAALITRDSNGVSGIVRESAGLMAVAWAVLVVGGMLVCTAMAHALNALAPAVPLGGWFGLVGIPALVIGALLLARARVKMAPLETLQQRAAEVADEAVQVAEQANEVIDSTRDVIENTVGNVKAVVNSVKNATDLQYQVNRRPWVMMAGALGLGYAGGLLLDGATAPHSSKPQPGNGAGFAPGANTTAPDRKAAGDDAGHGETGILAKLGEALAPQAALAREIAIGTLFGLARDFARDAVAQPLEQPVDDFFNSATEKFGGRPQARGRFKSAAASAPAEGSTPVA